MQFRRCEKSGVMLYGTIGHCYSKMDVYRSEMCEECKKLLKSRNGFDREDITYRAHFQKFVAESRSKMRQKAPTITGELNMSSSSNQTPEEENPHKLEVPDDIRKSVDDFSMNGHKLETLLVNNVVITSTIHEFLHGSNRINRGEVGQAKQIERMMEEIFIKLYQLNFGFDFNIDALDKMVSYTNWTMEDVLAWFKLRIEHQAEWERQIRKTSETRKQKIYEAAIWTTNGFYPEESLQDMEHSLEKIYIKLRDVQYGLSFNEVELTAISLLTRLTVEEVKNWFVKRGEMEKNAGSEERRSQLSEAPRTPSNQISADSGTEQGSEPRVALTHVSTPVSGSGMESREQMGGAQIRAESGKDVNTDDIDNQDDVDADHEQGEAETGNISINRIDGDVQRDDNTGEEQREVSPETDRRILRSRRPSAVFQAPVAPKKRKTCPEQSSKKDNGMPEVDKKEEPQRFLRSYDKGLNGKIIKCLFKGCTFAKLNKTSDGKKSYAFHTFQHTEDFDDFFNCKHCDEYCWSISTLDKHHNLKHPDEGKYGYGVRDLLAMYPDFTQHFNKCFGGQITLGQAVD